MTINAKEEFLDHIKGMGVLAARITTKQDQYVLQQGYSKKDYQKFLTSLNFSYNDGFGSQFLDGIIWYNDGTWSDRGEYGGSEWWEYRKCPSMADII